MPRNPRYRLRAARQTRPPNPPQRNMKAFWLNIPKCCSTTPPPTPTPMRTKPGRNVRRATSSNVSPASANSKTSPKSNTARSALNVSCLSACGQARKPPKPKPRNRCVSLPRSPKPPAPRSATACCSTGCVLIQPPTWVPARPRKSRASSRVTKPTPSSSTTTCRPASGELWKMRQKSRSSIAPL